MKVHILATVRREELLLYTTLVFKSLRVGFPTADIHVTGNNLEVGLPEVQLACASVGASFENGSETIHHRWLGNLLATNEQPFWVCDTDVVFYEKVEGFASEKPLTGQRIPEWNDAFSGCLTRARLHTSLLHLNPKAITDAYAKYLMPIAETPFTPLANIVDPEVIPFKGRGIFYDTTAKLYHAVGGQAFTDEQNDAYFHAHFGSISDIVLPRLGKDSEAMKQARDWIMEKPERGRGVWRSQQAYYEARQ